MATRFSQLQKADRSGTRLTSRAFRTGRATARRGNFEPFRLCSETTFVLSEPIVQLLRDPQQIFGQAPTGSDVLIAAFRPRAGTSLRASTLWLVQGMFWRSNHGVAYQNSGGCRPAGCRPYVEPCR